MLIIDMVNQFDFEDAASARHQLIDVVPRIRALRDAADRAQSPVIYINDNFGEWHSERSRLIARVEDHEEIAPILPRPSDYFVIKPQFSGFYATNLPVLLPKLGVDRLILVGVATEICVFVTAADAHMRDYRLWVPGGRGGISMPFARPCRAGDHAALDGRADRAFHRSGCLVLV